MKDSLRLVFVVTLICLVSALLVSIAHEITEEPIARTKARLKQEAVLAVLPQGASVLTNTAISVVWPDGSLSTNMVSTTDKGYALEVVAPNGYAGPIELMLGFTPDGTFWSYQVLAHSETPGLGSHITGSFIDHVRERVALTTNWKTTKDGGDIAPITAATISSRAVCDAIARGVVIFEAIGKQEALK